MDDFGLALYGPHGREIPYIGYVWAVISSSYMGNKAVEIPALVVLTAESEGPSCVWHRRDKQVSRSGRRQ